MKCIYYLSYEMFMPLNFTEQPYHSCDVSKFKPHTDATLALDRSESNCFILEVTGQIYSHMKEDKKEKG